MKQKQQKIKPNWLKIRVGTQGSFPKVSRTLKEKKLHTVCQEAKCPNKAECWGCGTATFMILGDICTRNCRFCAVTTSKKGTPVDEHEPERLAQGVHELGLSYVVLTSVDRDDLPDRGAGHFAASVAAIKNYHSDSSAAAKVEVLVPDYRDYELELLLKSGPDVVAHNVEVVERLQKSIRDKRAGYELSLYTLKQIKEKAPHIMSKSSILLGLGETEKELLRTMHDLRTVDCDSLVLGQYLQPTVKQVPVSEYITPEQFEKYRIKALEMGFTHVVSTPLARTSYHAQQAFHTGKK